MAKTVQYLASAKIPPVHCTADILLWLQPTFQSLMRCTCHSTLSRRHNTHAFTIKGIEDWPKKGGPTFWKNRGAYVGANGDIWDVGSQCSPHCVDVDQDGRCWCSIRMRAYRLGYHTNINVVRSTFDPPPTHALPMNTRR